MILQHGMIKSWLVGYSDTVDYISISALFLVMTSHRCIQLLSYCHQSLHCGLKPKSIPIIIYTDSITRAGLGYIRIIIRGKGKKGKKEKKWKKGKKKRTLMVLTARLFRRFKCFFISSFRPPADDGGIKKTKRQNNITTTLTLAAISNQ